MAFQRGNLSKVIEKFRTVYYDVKVIAETRARARSIINRNPAVEGNPMVLCLRHFCPSVRRASNRPKGRYERLPVQILFGITGDFTLKNQRV